MASEQAPRQLDLQQIVPKQPYSLEIVETSTSKTEFLEEMLSRIRMDELEKTASTKIRQQKHLFSLVINFILSLGLFCAVAAIFVVCLLILKDPQASVDDKKWATSILTLIASGGIGYITGRASTGKDDKGRE